MDALKQTMAWVAGVCVESCVNKPERKPAAMTNRPHKIAMPEWTDFALMEIALKNVRVRMKKMAEMVQTKMGAPRSIILESA